MYSTTSTSSVLTARMRCRLEKPRSAPISNMPSGAPAAAVRASRGTRSDCRTSSPASSDDDDEHDEQRAIDSTGEHVRRDGSGRHDTNVDPRAATPRALTSASSRRQSVLAHPLQQPDQHRERDEEHERRRHRFGVERLGRRDTNRNRRTEPSRACTRDRARRVAALAPHRWPRRRTRRAAARQAPRRARCSRASPARPLPSEQPHEVTTLLASRSGARQQDRLADASERMLTVRVPSPTTRRPLERAGVRRRRSRLTAFR